MEFLTVLETHKPKIEEPANLVSGKGPFSGLTVNSPGQREREFFGVSFYKVTNSIHEGSAIGLCSCHSSVPGEVAELMPELSAVSSGGLVTMAPVVLGPTGAVYWVSEEFSSRAWEAELMVFGCGATC